MPRGVCVVDRAGQRGDTTFSIKYVDAAGEQVWERLGKASEGWTRRKAEAELRERLVKVEKRGWRKPAPLTFVEYARRWFAEGPDRRGWTENTIAQYRSVERRAVDHFGSTPIAALRPRDVAGYVDYLVELGLAPATVGRDLSVISALLESAVRAELIERNPALRAERPKVPRRRWRILTPEEVAGVRRAFAELATDASPDERRLLEQHGLVFRFGMQTGMRRHEIENLRWQDVDLIENRVRVVKSKSEAGERSIAIPPGLCEDLWQARRASAYQGDGEYVFAHPARGSRLGAEAYADTFRAALARAGIDDYVRPFHDLRHGSLTLGAALGEGTVELMTRAGHANMVTTKGYLHLAGVVFPDAAARLEAAFATPFATQLGASETT